MSARIPTRRLGQSGLVAFRPRLIAPSRSFSCTLRLKADENTPKQDGKPRTTALKEEVDKTAKPTLGDTLSNPILEKYLEKHDVAVKPTRPEPRTGGLSDHESSVFKPEYEIPGWHQGISNKEMQNLKDAQKAREKQQYLRKEHDLHALKLDPAPAARRKLEVQLAIRDVLKNGRVTKAVKLARTERQSTYESPFLPTSVKKLTRIMHLIAGKTVEEALIQLRFSQKRIARDVRKGLIIARDEAIATRGMGIGGAQAAKDAFEAKNAPEAKVGEEASHFEVNEETEDQFEPYFADGTRRQERLGEGKLIELKDKTKKRVYDETEMYIDQAWVGRGEEAKSPEFRARGRINMLTHRTTMFTVVLKEEKTRMRLSEEIQTKRANKKLWLPLPDRPVTTQRQYCLW